MKYSIIIPCYNESENLEKLIKEIRILVDKKDAEIILVENGSTDNSREKMCALNEIDGKKIRAIYVRKNKGYGYGLQQGLKEARGDYVGWLHADLQVAPKEMLRLMNYVDSNKKDQKYFLKGRRKARSLFDSLFTASMTIYESIVFGKIMNDIGAIPVLFNRELLECFRNAPNDFSIELFSYYQAKKAGYIIKRFPVILRRRKTGKSSWDTGKLGSKIAQSKRIMRDSIKIKRGEKVL